MTAGAVIFAFDNEATDYLAMASWSAQRIRRFLDLPTAVITDNPSRARELNSFDMVISAPAQTGGHRWFDDYQQTVSWHNAARTDAYALSPWDRTLVLDADYVVNSADLGNLIDSNTDFLCFRNAYNIADPDAAFHRGFGRLQMPMYWATVMCFRRSTVTDWIFQSMNMIKNHWQHYRDLYHIYETNYRNDYALSIALALVNGSTPHVAAIPWSMASVLPDQRLSVNADQDIEIWNIEYTDNNTKRRTVSVFGMDFHAMGKRDLGDIIAGRARLFDTGHQSSQL
jgi:hypothetical protein